jgi:hypothetical protein
MFQIFLPPLTFFKKNKVDNKTLNPKKKKNKTFFYKSELSEFSEKLLIDKG